MKTSPPGLDAEEVAALGDISGYTGCWRLDGEPFYFVINEDFEWIAINLYGEQIGPGYVVNEDENITLCMEDGTELVSLWQTSYGDLSDANRQHALLVRLHHAPAHAGG